MYVDTGRAKFAWSAALAEINHRFFTLGTLRLVFAEFHDC